jgi:uncharacterized protein
MEAAVEGLPTERFDHALAALPHRFVFVTVSGSHLYGFPSADSDFDLRASHVLPGSAFWGLDPPRETEETRLGTGADLVEVVSHDLRKFAGLLARRNGYVLEQLTSPLVVRTSAAHAKLLRLVPALLTRYHYYHYRGFYRTERRDYDRSEPKSVKRLLYCYRVLMTGTVLLREGVLEANLQSLNRRWGFGFLDELVEIKRSRELAALTDDRACVAELERLEAELDRAFAETALPEVPPGRQELDRLIIRVRGEQAGED